jgi:hypothetical protein
MRMTSLAVVGLSVLGGLMSPTAATAQSPTQDSIVGAGSVLDNPFSVSITSGPQGEDPTGTLTIPILIGGEATPTCLNVQGHSATLAVTYFPTPGVSGILILGFTDNGPRLNGEPVDVVDFGLFPFAGTEPPTTCPAPGGPPPPFSFITNTVFSSGDITIHDAPPLPTSKDQCKNDGWRNFPGFKNQGDCVSFVATGGKNPPGGS